MMKERNANTMKKSRFLAAVLLTLSLSLTAGCNIFGNESEGIPSDVLFYTGCPLSFYYVDEQGNDLVNTADPQSFPTAFLIEASEESRLEAVSSMQQIVQAGTTYLLYNTATNSLKQDADLQRWGFQTYLWGRTPNKDYTTYVYAGGTKDSLKVAYKYLLPGGEDSEGITSGWGVKITSMLYNNVEVFLNNDNGKVFVEKPSQGGETVVHVGSI